MRPPPFAKLSSKKRKFSVSTSANALYGTIPRALFKKNWGTFGPFPFPNGEEMGKKWGSFLELYISIRQRVDHRDLLFEPPDINTISRKRTFSRQKKGWRKKKRARAYPVRLHAPDRDMPFDMVGWVT